MGLKGWAFFFVFLLSTDYIVVATSKLVRTKRQVQVICELKPAVTDMFDKCLDNVRSQMDNTISMPDNVENGIQLLQGSASNLRNFKRTTPLSCQCLGDRIRIFLQLSFIDVTVTFLVSVLNSLLGGLLGGLGSTITRLLGQIVNLVLNILLLEVNVIIAVDQLLVPGSTCKVFSYHVTRISGIRILNIDLTPLVVSLLGDLLTPILNTLVTQLLNNQVRAIITLEIEKLSIPTALHNCRS